MVGGSHVSRSLGSDAGVLGDTLGWQVTATVKGVKSQGRGGGGHGDHTSRVGDGLVQGLGDGDVLRSTRTILGRSSGRATQEGDSGSQA